MSFFSSFLGHAAQSTDRSMKEWQQMFQQQEQFDANMDMREKELAEGARQADQAEQGAQGRFEAGLEEQARQFDVSEENSTGQFMSSLAQRANEFDLTYALNEDRFEWDKELADLNQEWREREFDANALDSWYQNAMAGWGNMTQAERLDLISSFESMDPAMNPRIFEGYSGLLRSQVRDTMSARDARGYLANMLNQPLGTRVPEWVATEALNALEGEEDFENIQNQVNAFLEGNEEDFEKYRDQEWIDRQLQLDINRGQVQESAARVGLAEAQTGSLLQDMEISEELRPVLYRQEVARADLFENQAVQEGIRAGRLDEQITASLEETYANIRGLDNEAELFDATFEFMVEEMSAKADISRAEASYLIATESARIAIAEGQASQIQQTVRNLEAEERQINANIERTGVLMESDLLNMTEARVSIAQNLVESGDPELLGAAGRELLAPVVGEENVDALLEGLTEIATSNRSDEQKIMDANMRIAIAQAEVEEETVQARITTATSEAAYAEFKTSTMEEDREIENNLRERGMRVEEGQLSLLRDRYAWEHTVNMAKVEADADASRNPTTVLHDTRLALGQAPTDVQGKWDEYREAEADLVLLEGGQGVLTPEQLQAIAIRYQVPIDPAGMGVGIDPDVLIQYVSTKAAQLRSSAVASATSFITNGLSRGVMFTPSQLGFQSDLYDAALTGLGVAMADAEDVPGRADVQNFVNAAVTTMPNEGINSLGAADLWEQAEAAGLLPALNEMNIREPSRLYELVVQPTLEEYRHSRDAVDNMAGWYEGITGESPDMRTLEGIQTVEMFGSNLMAALERAAAVGADTRDLRGAQAVLNTLVEETGLTVDQLDAMGLVTKPMFGEAVVVDPQTLEYRIELYNELFSNGVTASHALYNW